MDTPDDAAQTIDPEINKANIADNVNDHTPDPDAPGVESLPDPPRPDREGTQAAGDAAGEAGDRIKALEAKVEPLVDLVENLVSKVTGGSDDDGKEAPPIIGERQPEDTNNFVDETSERLPWTHWGKK